MTNLLKFLCFALSLSGCGPVQTGTVDPDLAPYVTRFEQLWGYKVTFAVEQAVIDPKYGGICYDMATATPVVAINSIYWYTLTDDEKEELMFHELGHCALKRQHREDLNSDGSPVSVMYHQMFGNLVQYHSNRNAYIKELFGR